MFRAALGDQSPSHQEVPVAALRCFCRLLESAFRGRQLKPFLYDVVIRYLGALGPELVSTLSSSNLPGLWW